MKIPKSFFAVGLILLIFVAPIYSANASPQVYSLRVRWVEFIHEKEVMDDYILQVEFEVPSIGHYESKRTPCNRYISEMPPLKFDVEESWLNLTAKLTIMAYWHLDDIIIDINPNPDDGHWTPFGKEASALVISYMIWEPAEYSANGDDDGFLADLKNDAYIEFAVETLKDGEVVPEFTAATLIITFMLTALAVVIAKRRLR